MINVTYVGDLLIAYKVTGDKNVPRGEITFQADLSPLPKRVAGGKKGQATEPSEPLQPIMLTETSTITYDDLSPDAVEAFKVSNLPASTLTLDTHLKAMDLVSELVSTGTR